VGIIPVWPKRRLRFLHDASLYGAGAQHSQSPMTANGGAVMPQYAGFYAEKLVNIVLVRPSPVRQIRPFLASGVVASSCARSSTVWRGAPAPSGMRSGAAASWDHQRSVVMRRRNEHGTMSLSSSRTPRASLSATSLNSPPCSFLRCPLCSTLRT
jgi:hypothetical protein